MKKLVIAAAAAFGMAMAPAHATLVDFANEADTNGERGVADGTMIAIDGVALQLFAGDFINKREAFAYFDAGNAGLGVCKVLLVDQCNPASDDNVTDGEGLGINFLTDDFSALMARTINGLVFRDRAHVLINAGNDGLVRIVTSNGDMIKLFSEFMAMAAGGDAFFMDTTFIRLIHVGGQDGKEFYISAIDVSDVPIPAALPLLLSGLAGLGFASRKKKHAA